MKRSVTVEIAGNQYKVSSDADEKYLQRLADNINSRIATLGKNAARTAAPSHLLAIVALGLAEELETISQSKTELEKLTRSTITQVIKRIDQRLEADAELARQIELQ